AFALTRTRFYLLFIIRAVELPLRCRDQPILSDPPSLEPADANLVSRSGMSADQRPMVVRSIILHHDVVHDHPQIREISHERSSTLRDRRPAHRRIAVVHRERASRREKRSHTCRILAAPRGSIALRKISHFNGVHLDRLL